jgi:hypothetical protein
MYSYDVPFPRTGYGSDYGSDGYESSYGSEYEPDYTEEPSYGGHDSYTQGEVWFKNTEGNYSSAVEVADTRNIRNAI